MWDGDNRLLPLLVWLLLTASTACQSKSVEENPDQVPFQPAAGTNLEPSSPVESTAVRSPPPSDFPIYPNGQNLQSTKVLNTLSITLTCPGATREAVYEFYRQRMPQHGWVNKNQENNGSFLNLQFEKEGRLATITITGVTEGIYVIGNIIPRGSGS